MSDSDKKNISGFELDAIDLSQFKIPSSDEEIPESPEPESPEPARIPPPEPETNVPETAIKPVELETAFRTSASRMPGKRVWIAAAAVGIMGILLFFLLQLDGAGYFGNNGFKTGDRVVSLNNEILTSFKKLHNSLMKLKGLSKFTSNPAKINGTIQVIGLSEVLLAANNKATDSLISYTEKYGQTLERKGMGVFNEIGGYYRSKVYKRYKSATKQYLGSFRTVLQYRRKHHASIITGIQPYRDTHEMLYMRYRQSVKRHKGTYLSYLRFLDERVKQNKKLVGLMPVGRLRDTFWFNSTLKEMQKSWEF